MCYDISFTVAMKKLSDYFPELQYEGQINFEFQPVHVMGHSYATHPIIYWNRELELLQCRLMEWGVIPYYIKSEIEFAGRRASMLNIRSERILDDAKSYWYKIRHRRCLVPVTGIYEHRVVEGWKKKVPYFIEIKDQPVFFLPGLYSVAELPGRESGEMEKVFSYAIITRAANSLMQQIHNGGDNAGRMPLFLPLDLSKKWLSEDLADNEYRELLEYEMQSGNLAYRPVATIRSPKQREDGKAKNEYYEWPGLPAVVC